MALSLYLDHPSWLHRRHPVAKVLALVMLFVAAFLLSDPVYLAPLLALVVIVTASARSLPVLHRMRWLLLPVFFFTTIIWTVFFPKISSLILVLDGDEIYREGQLLPRARARFS